MPYRCMTLLRFSAENHKCFRDPMELDLVSSALKTQRPLDGDWTSVVHAVAGIFGPNASGKSTVLDAMAYAQEAVRESASTWLSRRTIPRAPFLLDEAHEDAPSKYVFDLVIDGIRHEYGFALSGKGINAEWLIDYPNGRRRLLFDRDVDRVDAFEFGRSFERPSAIAGAISANELLLSRGSLLRHRQLNRVASLISDGMELALFSDVHRRQRITAVVEALTDGTTSADDVLTLLRVADLGISGVDVAEQEEPMPPRDLVLEALARVDRQVRSGTPAATSPSPGWLGRLDAALNDDTAAQKPMTKRHLEFLHRGTRERGSTLLLHDESAGTISWLSLTVPAIRALRGGSLLLIDEIDASLHPHLSSLLIGLFQDRTLNRLGAQLIFTSHDTYLLAAQSDAQLSSEQIWFTQKDDDGAAELFCLADFTNRKTENVAKRYLAGRYGAVPRPAPSLLASLLDDVTARA